MNKVALTILAVLAILVTALGIWYHRGTPGYALSEIQQAIAEGNQLRFQRYVDLDRFLSAAVDQAMSYGLAGEVSDPDSSGLEALGALFGSAMAEQMKPAVVQMIRREILDGIADGTLEDAFRQEAISDEEAGLNLADLSVQTGATPASFRGLDDVVTEGDMALAGLRFHQEHLDTTLSLQLRLERTDRRWIVVAPEGLDRYLLGIDRLQQSHLAELNAEQAEEISRVVEVGTPRRTSERMFTLTTYEFEVPVRNVGNAPVHLRLGWLISRGGDRSSGEILFGERDRLEPGDSTMMTATALDGITSELSDDLRTGPVEDLQLELSLVVGEGDEARYLGAYASWDEYLERVADPSAYAQRILASRAQPGDEDLTGLLERAATGPWFVNERTDPLDDSPIVTLANTASEGRSQVGRAPSLILRCSDNRTEVYIAWSDYLGSDAPTVSYRIGDGTMQTSRWSMSTDNQATFYPGNDIALIRQLVTANRFVARVTPYNESPVTAVFELDGLPEHVGKLQEACNWE